MLIRPFLAAKHNAIRRLDTHHHPKFHQNPPPKTVFAIQAAPHDNWPRYTRDKHLLGNLLIDENDTFLLDVLGKMEFVYHLEDVQ